MEYRIDETVAYNVRALRLKKQMSQQALADRAGLSKQTISNIEKGLGATSKHLESIAQSLGVPPLLLYKEPEKDVDVRFKRVSPNASNLNTEQYVLDFERAVKSITEKVIDELYQQIVIPTVQEVFNQNGNNLLVELEADCSEENIKTLDAFKTALLDSIEQAVYNCQNYQTEGFDQNLQVLATI